ncbi:MAG: hypothetical protein ACOC7N_02735 [Chloroflexota bacterium]
MTAKPRSKPALYYEFRVSLGAASLLPLLGLPAFALLQWLFVLRMGIEVEQYELLRAFELVLPLSAGLAVAHLMTVEREAGMEELRSSYPEAPWRLPAARTLIAFVLAGAVLLVGVGGFRLVFGSVPWHELIPPALPPALFLLGLSLLAGNLTGSYWLAAALVLGYWFFELQTRGEITEVFFLFQHSRPLEGIDYDLNRRLLAGLGVLFLVLNAGWSARRKRGKGWRPRGDR